MTYLVGLTLKWGIYHIRCDTCGMERTYHPFQTTRRKTHWRIQCWECNKTNVVRLADTRRDTEVAIT